MAVNVYGPVQSRLVRLDFSWLGLVYVRAELSLSPIFGLEIVSSQAWA